MQFELGDVVRLKSGGPDMTVSKLTEDGYIGVVWFNTRIHEYASTQCEPEMLELTNDEFEGFYEAEDSEFERVLAKWRRGEKLSDEEWDIFNSGKEEESLAQTCEERGLELSDAELDSLVAQSDYYKHRDN